MLDQEEAVSPDFTKFKRRTHQWHLIKVIKLMLDQEEAAACAEEKKYVYSVLISPSLKGGHTNGI